MAVITAGFAFLGVYMSNRKQAALVAYRLEKLEAKVDKHNSVVERMYWGRAALIRAVRTFAEAALAYIGTGAVVLGDVNWLAALSAGGFGFVTAILLALTGLPEENLPTS